MADQPDIAEDSPPEKRPRTLRPIVLWSAAILAGLGLIWFGAKAIRLYQTHRIVKTARGDNYAVQETLDALGGQSNAIRRLSDYLEVPEKLVGAENRHEAAWILGSCGPGALPVAALILKDRDPLIRQNALVAILEVSMTQEATLKDGPVHQDFLTAITAVQAAVNDPDPGVRELAGKILLEINEKRVR